jgi:hypothetical protein
VFQQECFARSLAGGCAAETELAADEPLLDIVELAGVPLVRDVTHDGRFSGGVLANARR